MNKEELEGYKQKVWCNLQDFMKIASCGRNTGLNKMALIRKKMVEENYILPNNRILPMKKVLEYLGIEE